MKINVTQEDIDNGKVRNSCYCPVALAMRRVTKETWSVTGIGLFCDSKIGLNKSTPKSVLQFIRAFDIGMPVSPFEFEV